MEQGNSALADPAIDQIGPSLYRQPDKWRGRQELGDIPIISADGHFEISEDIFYENFPAALRDKAPRVWFDEFWNVGKGPEKNVFNVASDFTRRVMIEHSNTGLYDRDVRRHDLKIEGIRKEIVFPQSVLGLLAEPDHDVRECAFRIYNEYIARQSALDPQAFYGVGICSNWWDAEAAEGAIAQIKQLGLKTFMLPNNPGRYRSGKEIAWGDEALEPFWNVVEQSGLPVCFHVVEGVSIEGRGVYGAFLLFSLTPFRKTFGQLAFGGVFDRNPGLRVAFVEGGISWIAPMLQDAEMIYGTFGGLIEPRPKHRPSHYWHKHCLATFQHDRLGLSQIDLIGEDNIMWGSDYPHTEGSFGYTQHAVDSVIELTSATASRKILCENARKLFAI